MIKISRRKSDQEDRRENQCGVFQSHAVRDAVRDACGKAVVTTQSSIMRRGGGKFCRTVKEMWLSEEVSAHGCAHRAGG